MLALLLALLHSPAIDTTKISATPSTAGRAAPPGIYNGRLKQLAVTPPRIEASPKIDGVLDEPVWRDAAVLTGFSQYTPVDGQPADDSTEVLVWYSPTAIYFGVRAYAKPGTVHATLADRDKIYSDDYVGILLSTFNDHRQAIEFDLNPLGVQGDGALVETQQSSGGFGGVQTGRPSADLSPDFIFESKGRVTSYGYEIEIRIPFKSIKYQRADPQTWGINVIRRVQSSGQEDSWAPAAHAASSYLGQVGSLTGLTDLHRGIVLDLNPFVTQHAFGAPASNGYRYDTERPSLGTNVRWGITNNLTLNGTIKPDFAEVESDATQIQFDPRAAVYYPERRPFFLDGIEQFATPNNLIYTRDIISPVAAAKLTGKVAGTNIAVLSAVDDKTNSATLTDNPVYNVLRLQRDIGTSSKASFVYTDKVDGDQSNRVAGVDGRVVFSSIYSAQAQLAASRTVAPDISDRLAPLWSAAFARSGRTFALNYSMNAISEDFRASSGFISRAGIANGNFDHTVTWYGKPDAFFQTISQDVAVVPTWVYSHLFDHRDAQDKRLHFTTSATLRGGWAVSAGIFFETYGYDPALFANYVVERRTSSGVDTVPFVGTARIPNTDHVLQLATPQFKHWDLSIFYLWGPDENFFEWASAEIDIATINADWRPTDKLRVNATYNSTEYHRRTDGSLVGNTRIPRVKLEYQLSRPIFVRLVGEYDAVYQDNLRDDTRTNGPLLIRNADGSYTPLTGYRSNQFRPNALFSYQPSPGTVFFLGYGSTLTELDALRFRNLQRENDSFFVKLSYLWRL